jgi:ribosomal protein S18 acetylase RimI-like enzyme
VEYVIVPLEKTFDRTKFDCGNHALNRYIKERATQDIRNYYTVMFVAVNEETQKVIGFYTLSNTGVALSTVPDELKKKLPKYSDIPAIRLGRLAVDKTMQQQGLGSMLLANAIYRSIDNVAAWAMMIVDAKDDKAAQFYKRYGFEEFSDDNLHLFIMRQTLKNFLEGNEVVIR